MDVMLDLETLSTRMNATILIIAAIKFNIKDKHISVDKMDKFYRRIDIESCKEVGLHVDENTVKWWDAQDEKIRTEVFHSDRVPLKTALVEFTDWYNNGIKPERIWSQGANFDIPILGEAYKYCGMEIPWKYWQARDTRTIYELAQMSQRDLPKNNLHHALYDCQRQICGVKESYRRLNTK